VADQQLDLYAGPSVQLATLEALGTIGGPGVAAAVATIVVRQWVQGPSLTTAVAVAARLGAPLRASSALPLLRHADPTGRADACNLARDRVEVVATLLELMAICITMFAWRRRALSGDWAGQSPARY